MKVIPCEQNKALRKKIEELAEVLKTQSHTLGNHGLSEADFYNSGLFRGAVERIRGQFSASMSLKREFVKHVLNFMEDGGYISEWESAGESNRHDYSVKLPSGKTAIIELKGCLDGNNTLIFERPPHAEEFIIWSICTNTGADPRHNTWSGIHTRLSAEIIYREQQVDGVLVWDMVCGTVGRPCPKINADKSNLTELASYTLPPPCIYLMPGTVPSARNNPQPRVQHIQNVEILNAFHRCFKGNDDDLNYVHFQAQQIGQELNRKTTITRGGCVQKESEFTPIRRS